MFFTEHFGFLVSGHHRLQIIQVQILALIQGI